ncbi:MAG: Putative replication protein [Bifidobacterium crudilactis]|uniref:hypothetical protein n=1 Tax=Bifidobacterium crudilactis TaxID=327277 RepID=UPI003A5C56C2
MKNNNPMTAAAWNAAAKPIKTWNQANPDGQKKLPSIDRVRARGWMLTINAEKHEKSEVDSILGSVPTAAVYSEEAGSTTGYKHFQAFAYWEGKTTGNRVRSLFGDAHVEPAGKPVVACAAYCSKDRTHLSGPYWLGAYETVPGMKPTTEQTTRRSQFDDAVALIAEGYRYEDFLNDYQWMAWALRHRQAIQDLIMARNAHLYGEYDRAVSVDYIHGPAGSGKTKSVLDLYGRRSVFMADLGSAFPFDGYSGESVLLLDDFRSSIVFNDLLRILDRYPLRVNVKGSHSWACWTKVVISANISLAEQYPNLSERKDPLLRRFEHGIVYEKTSPAVPLPYASREDAMKGVRNDNGTNGVPGYTPMWEREKNDSGFSDADFDAPLD